jgi:hypothetical protein
MRLRWVAGVAAGAVVLLVAARSTRARGLADVDEAAGGGPTTDGPGTEAGVGGPAGRRGDGLGAAGPDGSGAGSGLDAAIGPNDAAGGPDDAVGGDLSAQVSWVGDPSGASGLSHSAGVAVADAVPAPIWLLVDYVQSGTPLPECLLHEAVADGVVVNGPCEARVWRDGEGWVVEVCDPQSCEQSDPGPVGLRSGPTVELKRGQRTRCAARAWGWPEGG